jgi:amidase
VRQRLRDHLAAVLEPGDVVLAPAAGRPAPRAPDAAAAAEARRRSASLSVVGSLAGLPTVTIPAALDDELPVGLSLVAAPGSDGLLLDLAAGRPPVAAAPHPRSA